MSNVRVVVSYIILLPGLLAYAGIAFSEKSTDSPGFMYFPLQQIYTRYIADPLRTSFSAKAMVFNRTDIPDTGKLRFGLRVGGALPLLQYNGQTIQSQLILEGGFLGQFDVDHSEDNIGWEGIYSLYLAVRFNEAFAVRVGRRHFSSHVGDEYAERTGRKRINYTREEMRAGINWAVTPQLLVYFDSGYATTLRNKSKQKPWRHQLGIQLDKPRVFYNSGLGWYAAVDVSAYQENDFSTNTSLQLGLLVPREQRNWRFFLEYYNGRMQVGEFFEHNESYYALGLSIDV
ncbi:DUF1207 domain-containing protein [Beggiatoa alba]|nr:DUF1207 domain-containing protein [Beggiatoa alba]